MTSEHGIGKNGTTGVTGRKGYYIDCRCGRKGGIFGDRAGAMLDHQAHLASFTEYESEIRKELTARFGVEGFAIELTDIGLYRLSVPGAPDRIAFFHAGVFTIEG